MPKAQAAKKQPVNGPTLAIVRVDNDLDELQDIIGAIEQRAFELFERRDGECGHDLADWFAAEVELVYRTLVTIDDQGDRVEVRIGLDGHTADDVSLLLTNQQLVLRSDARGDRGAKGKWLLVRVDLPVGVSLDLATAAVESGSFLVILRRQEA
jgi:HSP20 family molecular chaperone IbpA